MKYYYLMLDDNKHDTTMDCAKANLYGIDKDSVCTGKVIENFDERIVFEYTSFEGEIKLDYLPTPYIWLTVSKRTKEVWDKYLRGDEIQYINIPLKDLKTGAISYDYYIANIVNVLDAQNMEFSKTICEFDREHNIFTHYAVDETKVENEHVFKLRNIAFKSFISEPIKKAMKKAKLKGFDFGNVRVVDDNGNLV